MKIKTCGECEHKVGKVPVPGFVKIWGCGLSDPMWAIPQNSVSETKTTTFKRIPLDCPRPRSEVVRSSKPQNPSAWTFIGYDE